MYTLFFSIFIGLISLAVAIPLRKKSLKASETRLRKAIKNENPDAGEEKINEIMNGEAENWDREDRELETATL